MKRSKAGLWIVRISWAVLGGLWGAWLGYSGHSQLPHNADSFATMLATGFYGFFSVVGCVSGMAAGAVIGGVAERLLRSVGVGTVVAVLIATLVSAAALWQIGSMVQARFPGLRSAVAKPAVGPTRETQLPRPCDSEPAASSPQHASWEAECR